MACLECETATAVVADPRIPPLSEDENCLCLACAIEATYDVWEQLYSEMSDIKHLRQRYIKRLPIPSPKSAFETAGVNHDD